MELHFAVGEPCGRVDISGPNGTVGRLMLLLMGDQAAAERTTLQEALQRGRRKRAAAGRPIPGNGCKYGYRLVDATDPTTSKLVPKHHAELLPTEAAVVARIFTAFLGGTSIHQIVRDLMADGVPNAHGGAAWGATTVRRILTDSRYCGRAYTYRWECTRLAHKKYTQTLRPEAEQVALPPGTYPAIVTEAVFAAVQFRLAESKRLAARANAHPERTLVRGYTFCGVCGDRLRVQNLTPAEGGGARYACARSPWNRERHRAAEATGAPAGHGAIRAEDLDRAAWAAIKRVCTDPDLVAHELRKLETDDGTILAEETARAQAVLDDLLARERSYIRMGGMAVDQRQTDEIQAMLTMLGTQRQQAEAALAKLQRRVATRGAALHRIDDAQTLLKRLGAHIDSATFAERRELVALLIAWVKLFPVGAPARYLVKVKVPDPASPLTEAVFMLLRLGDGPELDAAMLADPDGMEARPVADTLAATLGITVDTGEEPIVNSYTRF